MFYEAFPLFWEFAKIKSQTQNARASGVTHHPQLPTSHHHIQRTLKPETRDPKIHQESGPWIKKSSRIGLNDWKAGIDDTKTRFRSKCRISKKQ